ncbi:hypothetical protein LL252_03575 [Alcanivorax marinus]|uniref:Flp family type IVb pilin n=1 Tax=Alloalcanivorax marinus TaxID=1177169 RepID=A0A9Q3UKS6_9GAMM|nr:hypothetical protein [Alloalcanivorax marinus]MCC4307643.1 hypothetical protein [Alloalcanivorax marinus]
MKPITQLHFGLQKLAVRLFGGVSTRADKQRGASALEYIMLAAVVIAILVFLSTNTGVRQSISGAFQDVFDAGGKAATDAAGSTGG